MKKIAKLNPDDYDRLECNITELTPLPARQKPRKRKNYIALKDLAMLDKLKPTK